MKKIKYISSIILILTGLIITGELNAYQKFEYLTALPPYPYISYDLKDNWDTITIDITTIAEKNNVIVFVYDKKSISIIETNIVVYSTKELPEQASQALGVGLDIHSLTFGRFIVFTDSFDNITTSPSSPWLYLIGDAGDIYKFTLDLSELYIQTSPLHEAYRGTPYDSIIVISWIIIVLSVLLLTLLDVFYQKKEVLINVILGRSILRIIVMNIISDAIVSLIIFVGGYFILVRFTMIWYRPNIIWSVLFILFILNSAIYFILANIDSKYVTSNSITPKLILKASYIIKSFILLPSILAIVYICSLLQPTYKYIKANSFFTDHKDYYFCYFSYIPIDMNIEGLKETAEHNNSMNLTIYSEYFDICKPIVLYGDSMTFGEIDTIYANIYAYEYISSVIGNFLTDNIDMCLLIPDEADSERVQEILNYVQWLTANQDSSYIISTQYYNSNVSMLCTDYRYAIDIEYTFAINPIIIFDNTVPSEKSRYPDIFQGTTIYQITEEIKTDIITRFSLDNEMITTTNAYELYYQYWFLTRVELFMAIIIGTLTLMLNILMAHRIINSEYIVNAIEISIKRVFGYGLVRRNIDTVVTVFGFDFLCVLVSMWIYSRLNNSIPGYFFITVAILIIIDAFVLVKSIIIIEKTNISRILKGGAA